MSFLERNGLGVFQLLAIMCVMCVTLLGILNAIFTVARDKISVIGAR